jgi:hypothetical protein
LGQTPGPGPRYDPQMRVVWGAALVLILASAGGAAAAEPAALARARALYNAGTFDAAIDAAATARREPDFADAASLVLARAHLERYRLGSDPVDLSTARDTLAAIRADALSSRDQIDLLIGLGQTLYLGDAFGAAAELFDTALGRGSMLGLRERRLLLDWWATALDREAQTRAAGGRPPLYVRLAGRMDDELRVEPGSPVANYWLVVAARGEGDLDRAWDAAVAGWVRATLAPESTEKLRADIDRLVTQALIAERIRTRPAREQADAGTALRAEWDMVKQNWK